MIDLINDINTSIYNCIGGKGKFYGLCRQMMDDNGIYPATVEKNEKVTPLDKWNILVYHRYLDGSVTDDETFSFGRHPLVKNAQGVRMVVIVAFTEGESAIDDIINGMPDRIENVDYKFSEVGTNITLIRDRHSIWDQEFGAAYRDKYQVRYNIYAVEYTLDYIKCSDCVSS